MLRFFSSPPWDSVTYWALDLETGGLDPKNDPIIAVGMVPLRDGTIRLAESYRTLVRPADGRRVDPESVRAHQLVWGELVDAPAEAAVMREVERRLRDGVLLVHHRGLDVAFLRRAFKEAKLSWPSPRVVDTVDLLVRAARPSPFSDPHLAERVPALNLTKARREHGLPEYQAHDALTDAVAAAELFLVLRKKLGARTLRDLR